MSWRDIFSFLHVIKYFVKNVNLVCLSFFGGFFFEPKMQTSPATTPFSQNINKVSYVCCKLERKLAMQMQEMNGIEFEHHYEKEKTKSLGHCIPMCSEAIYEDSIV